MAKSAEAKAADDRLNLDENDPLYQLSQIMSLKKPAEPKAETSFGVDAMASELDPEHDQSTGSEFPSVSEDHAAELDDNVSSDEADDVDFSENKETDQPLIDDSQLMDDLAEAISEEDLEISPLDEIFSGGQLETPAAQELSEVENESSITAENDPNADIGQRLRELTSAAHNDELPAAENAAQVSDAVDEIDFEDDELLAAAFAEIDDDFGDDPLMDDGAAASSGDESPLDEIFGVVSKSGVVEQRSSAGEIVDIEEPAGEAGAPNVEETDSIKEAADIDEAAGIEDADSIGDAPSIEEAASIEEADSNEETGGTKSAPEEIAVDDSERIDVADPEDADIDGVETGSDADRVPEESIENRIASIFGRATPVAMADEVTLAEEGDSGVNKDSVLADLMQYEPSTDDQLEGDIDTSPSDVLTGSEDLRTETAVGLDEELEDIASGEALTGIDEALASLSNLEIDASEPADDVGVFSRSHDVEPPQIETIELEDEPVSSDDDLEIPEVAEFEDPAPAFAVDDIDADLTRDFETPEETVDDPVVNEDLSDEFAGLFDEPDELASLENSIEEIAAAAAAGAGIATGVTARATLPGDEPQTNSSAPDFVKEHLQASVWDDTAEEPKSNRKGLLIAAMVAGVALLGGIGAFALSYGGGEGTTEPVVIKADSDPVKVKPKDPGGTKVPNQDNKVYERVAGGEDISEPTQKTLVTGSEEPIDLSENKPIDAVSTNEPVKSEDRLAPGVEVTRQLPQTDDPVALVPRRVKTMIVRPDGTLVARETTPAPTAPAEETGSVETQPAVAETQPAAVPVPEANPAPKPAATTRDVSESLRTETKLPEAAKTETEETAPATGPTPAPRAETQEAEANDRAQVAAVEPVRVRTQTIARPADTDQTTPANVPVVPSRPADQPVNVIGTTRNATPAPALGRDEPQQVAAADRETPATTAPAATTNSRFSVQIASQPSRQAAEQTYIALARRYGSLLEGRGRNIVEAEIAGRGTYYRVRIPAQSRQDAINLCSRYKAAGGECFVP